MQLGGGAGEGYAAVAEDLDAVGDLEDLADFLLDDQDGHRASPLIFRAQRSSRREEAFLLFTIDRGS